MRFGGIFDLEPKRNRLRDIEHLSNEGEFWLDQKNAQLVLQEKAGLERLVGFFDEMEGACEDAGVLLEFALEGDEESASEAKTLVSAAEDDCKNLETQRLLGGEGDQASAILEINSGAGGTDASDWAEMLKRMYLRWAERRGYKASLVDEQSHDEAGIKHCAMTISGPFAYGYLKAEIGVHRLVRISPFDANARRHTAFASVAVYPDIEDTIEVDINPADLRIDTYRSSGAGGQHVNTTDSAVRITHAPTGIVVTCQNERSQHKNKATAMKMLKARIYQHELMKRQETALENRTSQKKIEWGSQIRNYVLHPYRMVKDARTGAESGDVDGFLDGDLTHFMEAWLGMRADQESETT
jgi:peptide chain release factor 2